MWKILAVVIASLAGACVMEEPVGQTVGVSWSEAEDNPDFGRRPPREDCTANVQACLSSGLGSVPGGQPGSSRCKDCLDVCQGQHYWPDRLFDGKDCQWWNH
jgi:hypothetical protein